MIVYIGTYTDIEPHARGRADGIYVFECDRLTGALALVDVVSGVVNPSFLALAPDGRSLYAVHEVPEIDGHEGGAVSAFAVDQTEGSLSFLNRQPSGGTDPCHISVDATGRLVLVANYGSGTVAALPVDSMGQLLPSTVVHQHVGSGPVADRQERPHAHHIRPDPSNHFALANDLGTDQVVVYRMDAGAWSLRSHDLPHATLPAGSGPRHLAFHPNGRICYVTNELNSTLTACLWDRESGRVHPVQSVSTLPDTHQGSNSCADVHVSPSGRFVYGSNRGHDSIVTFAAADEGGLLTLVGHVSTFGKTPRSFSIDPDGVFLLVANQDTDTIVTFRLDASTGLPVRTDHVASVPSPVCVTIAAGS